MIENQIKGGLEKEGKKQIKGGLKERKLRTLHEKACFNEMYIRGDRPVAVYKKHINKILYKDHTVIMHAMTAAINKAVQLFVYVKQEYPYLNHKIVTDSVPTLVEDQHGNQQIKERSAIHITLKKGFNQIN